jgi:hypothetical protein
MQLARALPDVPRWVETRSVLLSGWGEIFGLEEEGEPRFVVRDPEDKLVYIVGYPAQGAIRDAVSRSGEGGVVIAQLEAESDVGSALPSWNTV